MGLFDFVFGRKKNTVTNPIESIKPKSVRNDSITANKVEITRKNYEDLCKEFIAFDVETTGLSSDSDVIIEVGAVKFVNGKAIDSYGSLVNEGIPVPDAASRVNHITTKMLKAHGKQPKLVYHELSVFLENVLNGNTYICAHNAPFDIAFLCNALERFGYNGCIHYLDTLSLSRRMIKGLSNYKQDTVADYFGLKNIESHRATTDAEICGRILVNLLDIKKDEIERDIIREENCKPTDEEKETFAIIANAMEKNGSNIQNLRTYRNTSNYVHILDTYTVLKYKISKKKSFVVVPKLYAYGLQKIEDCTITEGIDNVRILFDDPFELEDYGKMFSKLHKAMRKSQGAHMNHFEVQYLSQANLTGFTDTEIKRCLECAKERQRKKAELCEQAIQKEREKAALIEARKEEKAAQKQEIEKKKQAKMQAKMEQQELTRKIFENSVAASKEDIYRISKLSAECGKRAVIQLDDEGHILRIYESIKEASDSVSIAPKTIRDVANGKYKHGGGFCWMYADEIQ